MIFTQTLLDSRNPFSVLLVEISLFICVLKNFCGGLNNLLNLVVLLREKSSFSINIIVCSIQNKTNFRSVSLPYRIIYVLGTLYGFFNSLIKSRLHLV